MKRRRGDGEVKLWWVVWELFVEVGFGPGVRASLTYICMVGWMVRWRGNVPGIDVRQWK